MTVAMLNVGFSYQTEIDKMPYYISNEMNDCQGWATIKADTPDSAPETIGCHQTKQDAIDQMIAVSLSEELEPMGDWATRALLTDIELITDDDMNQQYEMKQVDASMEVGALQRAYDAIKSILDEIAEKIGESEVQSEDEDESEIEIDSREQRQIDLSAPQFMRDNAKRGLEYHEEGLSGDGLQPQTVEDARSMASGDVTVDKWRKIAPWIARHMVDLEAADGEITAGVVAHLLWGSGSTKEEAQRTMDYAQGIIDSLDAELEDEERTAPAVREHRWVISKSNEQRKQIAYTNLELRALDDSEDGWTVSGYAAVFDSPSEPLPWTEFVRRGAFKKTINDGADVRLLIDHTGVPLARTKSGTLTLREDDKGLFMEARLDPNNPDAVKMRSALMRGDVTQMSFAFETIKDGWNGDRSVRELKEVRLHDVSLVTYPAYEETSAEIRNNQSNETMIATVASTSLRKAQIALAMARAVN
jgi:HK97 family phage prohead protease